jgi:hypothetical protein
MYIRTTNNLESALKLCGGGVASKKKTVKTVAGRFLPADTGRLDRYGDLAGLEARPV